MLTGSGLGAVKLQGCSLTPLKEFFKIANLWVVDHCRCEVFNLVHDVNNKINDCLLFSGKCQFALIMHVRLISISKSDLLLPSMAVILLTLLLLEVGYAIACHRW